MKKKLMLCGIAVLAAATGTKHELMRPPVSGSELPFSKFTKRRRERRDFDAEDSGKTVFFCIRVENAKGGPRALGNPVQRGDPLEKMSADYPSFTSFKTRIFTDFLISGICGHNQGLIRLCLNAYRLRKADVS